MSPIVLLLIIITALFAAAFLSKRRFGLLGLGLAAGATLAPLWGENAGYVVSATGLIPEGPFVNVIAVAAVTLVPAILFMFHGYSYKSMFGRVVGALLFTGLAIGFLITPLSTILTISGPVGGLYQWFIANKDLILSAGIIIAVVDIMIAKPVHKKEDKKHH